MCNEALAHPDRNYLLLIDEINRANVAKVLGELITLLEPDKRGMRTTLAQSGELFQVPPNVYVLGTMNTSDRSIRLLDVALRRRFGFIELGPDTAILSGAKVGPLELDEFLLRLNAQIASIAGPEKRLGHAYFLADGQPVAEPEQFAELFRQDVLPLLEEYCFDDYKRLNELLGEKLAPLAAQQVNQDVLADPDALVDALRERFFPRLD
jgi:5-methylcytosine-specific restriction protein B